MRAFFKAIVATAALAAPFYANAIPMSWTYSGVCQYGDCSAVPTISGTLTGDPTRRGADDELNDPLFGSGDLDSYDFWIGSYHLFGGGGSAVGSYELDSSGNIKDGSMTFGNILQLVSVGDDAWSIFYLDCGRHGCSAVDASGAGSYKRATSVPEPATLSLLGLGILAVGFAVRSRKV